MCGCFCVESYSCRVGEMEGRGVGSVGSLSCSGEEEGVLNE